MRERILEFIASENITAAEFADRIGVQRSSVSHVLNGRNNPGFAFIQKILETFPEVNSRWLLTGEGQMRENADDKKKFVKDNGNLFSTAAREIPTIPVKEELAPIGISNIQHTENQQENLATTASKQHSKENEKTVTRVLIFYDDHTFEDFRPAK